MTEKHPEAKSFPMSANDVLKIQKKKKHADDRV